MNVVIKTNGDVIQVQPKNGNDFTFTELQSIVDGYIEIIPLADNHIMVLNEEGKGMGLPFNEKATYLYQNHYNPYDYIVGDVLVCEQQMVK